MDYKKTNKAISALRESNISNFLNVLSEEETVKKLLKQKVNGTNDDDQENKPEISYIVSDLFQSIAQEGMTTKEIFEYIYKNYEPKEINEVAKKIKVVHTEKDYTLGSDNLGKSVTTNSSNFYLKVDDPQFGVNYVKNYNPNRNYSMNYIIEEKPDNNSTRSRINNEPESPSRTDPNLVCIMHNDPRFRCGTKNSLELSTFWNLLSNVELSKMYPYLNATFKLPRFRNNRKSSKKRKFKTATVNQFINGTLDSEDSSTENYNILEAGFGKKINSDSSNTEIEGTEANLSIFTMPQTINNFNEPQIGHYENYFNRSVDNAKSNVKNRTTTVHDITRPFMTIQSFDIDIAPSQGLLSFKSGRLSLILHDRTRMNDIAPFVKPDLFGSFGAEVVLEYGWSHIDSNKDNTGIKNHIAEFIENSKVTEKYIITNSSFSIQKDGSVKIDLGIAMRGPLDIRNVFIERDPSLTITVGDIRTSLEEVIDAFQQDGKRSLSIDIDVNFVRIIEQIISQKKIDYNSDNGKKILKLINLFSKKKVNGVLNEVIDGGNLLKKIKKANSLLEDIIVRNIDVKLSNEAETLQSFTFDAIDSIINTLKSLFYNVNVFKIKQNKNKKKVNKAVETIVPNTNHDPFIDKELINFLINNESAIYAGISKKDIEINLKSKSTKKKNQDPVEKIKKEYISFGAFVSSLIGTHLTNTGKFDEIQVIFYTTNEECGAMSARNIASFLIEISALEDYLSNLFKEKLKFTIEGILNSVIQNFISTRSQTTYGFSKLFKQGKPGSGKKEPIGKADGLDASISKILNNVYKLQTGANNEFENVFKMPRVGFSFDTLTTKKGGYNRTISKISIFDRNDNPFSSLNSITRNIEDSKGILLLNKKLAYNRKKYKNKKTGKLTQEFFNRSANLIQEFIDKGYIDKDVSSGNLIIKNEKNGISSLKHKFKEMMPSATYGSQNSCIIDANVTTVNEAQLNTIFLTRPNRNDNERFNVQFETPLPLRILPTQATVTTFGCPFVNFAQYVFLDFETGTTMDNIYSVASIKHSLTPGSFKTTLTLSYGDVYGKYETAGNQIAKAAKKANVKSSKQKEAEKAAAEKAAAEKAAAEKAAAEKAAAEKAAAEKAAASKVKSKKSSVNIVVFGEVYFYFKIDKNSFEYLKDNDLGIINKTRSVRILMIPETPDSKPLVLKRNISSYDLLLGIEVSKVASSDPDLSSIVKSSKNARHSRSSIKRKSGIVSYKQDITHSLSQDDLNRKHLKVDVHDVIDNKSISKSVIQSSIFKNKGGKYFIKPEDFITQFKKLGFIIRTSDTFLGIVLYDTEIINKIYDTNTAQRENIKNKAYDVLDKDFNIEFKGIPNKLTHTISSESANNNYELENASFSFLDDSDMFKTRVKFDKNKKDRKLVIFTGGTCVINREVVELNKFLFIKISFTNLSGEKSILDQLNSHFNQKIKVFNDINNPSATKSYDIREIPEEASNINCSFYKKHVKDEKFELYLPIPEFLSIFWSNIYSIKTVRRINDQFGIDNVIFPDEKESDDEFSVSPEEFFK